jgi:hypothetical protein
MLVRRRTKALDAANRSAAGTARRHGNRAGWHQLAQDPLWRPRDLEREWSDNGRLLLGEVMLQIVKARPMHIGENQRLTRSVY